MQDTRNMTIWQRTLGSREVYIHRKVGRQLHAGRSGEVGRVDTDREC